MSHTDEGDTPADPSPRDVLRVAALRAQLALASDLEPCGAAWRTLRAHGLQALRDDPWMAQHAPTVIERTTHETE